MPPDQCVDGGDDRLSLRALIPPQIPALVEPRDRVVIEHAGEQGTDNGPWIISLVTSQYPRVAARTTASDGVERTQGFVDRVPVGVPLLAAPEEFSYQLFSLLGVAGRAKPPRTRLNLY